LAVKSVHGGEAKRQRIDWGEVEKLHRAGDKRWSGRAIEAKVQIGREGSHRWGIKMY